MRQATIRIKIEDRARKHRQCPSNKLVAWMKLGQSTWIEIVVFLLPVGLWGSSCRSQSLMFLSRFKENTDSSYLLPPMGIVWMTLTSKSKVLSHNTCAMEVNGDDCCFPHHSSFPSGPAPQWLASLLTWKMTQARDIWPLLPHVSQTCQVFLYISLVIIASPPSLLPVLLSWLLTVFRSFFVEVCCIWGEDHFSWGTPCLKSSWLWAKRQTP